MAHDVSRFGMRMRGNRPGFEFGSEKAIQFSFQEDVIPEIAEQRGDVKDVVFKEETIERQVFNQPRLIGEDRFMMPFQAMSESERLKRQAERDVQKARLNIDAKIW